MHLSANRSIRMQKEKVTYSKDARIENIQNACVLNYGRSGRSAQTQMGKYIVKILVVAGQHEYDNNLIAHRWVILCGRNCRCGWYFSNLNSLGVVRHADVLPQAPDDVGKSLRPICWSRLVSRWSRKVPELFLRKHSPKTLAHSVGRE